MVKHNLSLGSLYSKSPRMAWLFEDEICPQTQRRAKDGNLLTPAGVAVLEVGGQQEPSGDRGRHRKFLLGLAAESLLESLQTWRGSRSALRALRLPARHCGEERGLPSMDMASGSRGAGEQPRAFSWTQLGGITPLFSGRQPGAPVTFKKGIQTWSPSS